MYVTTAASLTFVAEGFTAPGPGNFQLPPAFSIGGLDVTKSMLLIVLSGVLIIAVTYVMARPAAVVPGRLQFAGEAVYGFVRNGIARDSIGTQDFMKFVPYLFSLFLFVFVNNYYGVFPFLQFPTFSRISYVYGLAALTWFVYNGVGIARHGFFGYLRRQTVPGGMKGPILVLLIPLEFLSNIVVRPATLALRLFANMFAGHLLLILFSTGAAYLIFESDKLAYAPVGILSFILGILVSFLELLVMFLQAYVFTLLTAMYIGGALADEH
ncbi:F0F1 ATP synthase subunit A [Aeromicrobium sp. SMF47]|uniref:ATP synthase subunit a n=1 Tax=Aeromicrobium yanjiei TaxID=2662028 RepID=A0A5Q2MK44_9ACTN|nr:MULTISPECIES: F0F1 ATP synthase subunit A [Aeromicrobium]MRJ76736.1 F0F1 ATP synthase subunit A [Aeromicrobium yanjiei]MRK01080.1 F0F1 ATP synthase subunit A [Aeromicrobium sp. S22]QGG42121.1 F0F1 ATP synthase subunit A [Aeromicrobium yanjiei]